MDVGEEQSQQSSEKDGDQTEEVEKGRVDERKPSATEAAPSETESLPLEQKKRQWLSWECFKTCSISNPAPPFGRPIPVRNFKNILFGFSSVTFRVRCTHCQSFFC